MIAKPERAKTPSDTPKLDVAAAMERLGVDVVTVRRTHDILVLPSRRQRREWRSRGLLTGEQEAVYSRLRRAEGQVVSVMDVVAAAPAQKSGVGRPLALDAPGRDWEDIQARLGPEVSDVAAARALDVSVRTIIRWRKAGYIPPKSRRAKRVSRD